MPQKTEAPKLLRFKMVVEMNNVRFTERFEVAHDVGERVAEMVACWCEPGRPLKFEISTKED